MANGFQTTDEFTEEGQNDIRRPNFETVQDETLRIDPSKKEIQEQPEQIPEGVGEPVSEEEFILEAANKGQIDLGEVGEPLTEQQFMNQARVKAAADQLSMKIAQKEQEMLEAMKRDEPGYRRAISAANTTVQGLLEFAPGAVKTSAVIGAGLYNVFASEENDITAEDTDWYKAGQTIGGLLKEAFPDSPFYREEFWAGTIAKGGGQMLGNILAAASTGGQSLWATAGASAAFNATLSSNYYEQAKAEGASEEEAFNNTLVNMMGVSAIEAIPMVTLARRINKATGNGLVQVLKNGFKGSLEEGMQESVQTMFENVSGQAIYDSQRQLMDGVYEAGMAGAILGGAANVSISSLVDKRNFAQKWQDRIASEEAIITTVENYGDVLPQFQNMSPNERIKKMKELLELHKPENEVTLTEAGFTEMGVYNPEVSEISDLNKKKFKKLWIKYLRTGGLESKQMQVLRERRNSKIDRDLEQMQINMTRLNKAILESYDSKYKKDFTKAANDPDDAVPGDIAILIDQALRGEEVNMPDNVKAEVNRMRLHVKSLSKSFMSEGLISGDLTATFLKNLGSYIHRDYKLFNEDIKWDKETIPEDVWQRGLGFMRNQIRQNIRLQNQQMSNRTDQLKAMMKNQVPLEQREQALPEITKRKEMSETEINRLAEEQLEKIIEARGPNTIHKMFNETSLSKEAGDRSVLLQKQDIPKPIRDVMGEYKDGAVNYVNTINKMAQHLHRRKFFDIIAEEFRGKLFYTRQELKEQGLDVNNYTPEFNDGGLGSKLSNDGENALWMHKELQEIMTESANPSRDHGALMTLYLRGIGAAKYSKTVLSHVAHIRNLFGGTSFLLNQGLVYQKPGTAKGSFKRARSVFKSYESLNKKDLEEQWLHYVDLGLTGGSVKAGELRDIIADMRGKDFDTASEFMEEMFNHHEASKKGAGAYATSKSWFRKYSRKATNLYKAEDTFLRVYMFEMEKARLKEAVPDITDQQVADIVNDLYPNYDRVNNFVKKLRMLPFAPFISFPAEVIRTTINTARRAATELGSDNKKLNKIGRKRVAGIVTNMIGWTALGVASQAVLGMGDEEEQSIREFLPPWSRNSSILYLGKSEGKVRYINLSYTNPYEFLTDPVFSIIRGDSDREVTERFLDGMKQMVEPVYNPELFAKALGDVYYNSSDGSEIWNPEDDTGTKLQKQMLYLWNQSIEPGSFSSAERIMEPILDETSSRNVSDELLGFAGLRVSTVDVARSYGFRIRDYRKRIRNAKRKYNSVKYKKGTSISEEREALNSANESYRDIFQEMRQMTDAAQMTGVDWFELKKIMKDSGLANRDINAIRSGIFQPFSY